jgi:hypothetical protein
LVWQGEGGFPGVQRDVIPVWRDANLGSLPERIRSRLFLAHARASTGTSTSRENCHFASRIASDGRPPSLFRAEGGAVSIRDARVEMKPGRRRVARDCPLAIV